MMHRVTAIALSSPDSYRKANHRTSRSPTHAEYTIVSGVSNGKGAATFVPPPSASILSPRQRPRQGQWVALQGGWQSSQ